MLRREHQRFKSASLPLSSPPKMITSWKIDRETIETVTDFIFLGFKTIADGEVTATMKLQDTCSLEEKL